MEITEEIDSNRPVVSWISVLIKDITAASEPRDICPSAIITIATISAATLAMVEMETLSISRKDL